MPFQPHAPALRGTFSESPGLPPLANSALARYFEASVYLLLLTAVAAVVSTGKLDLASAVGASVALGVKAVRRWRGYAPELSHGAATAAMVACLVLMPVDDLTWSAACAASAPNPGLYAALLTAIHFLLLAILLRLYSARTRRDYLFVSLLGFAAMLAAAVLTVDTTFLALFVLFVLLGVSTFISLELDRGSDGAVCVSMAIGSPPARRMLRALVATSVLVTGGIVLLGALIFFLLPRYTGGYFSSYSTRPALMTGFTETVELGQIGEIQNSSAVVMRVKIQGDPARFEGVRWRGIALTTFDGWRWSAAAGPRERLSVSDDGWFHMATARRPPAPVLQYRVLLEPVASDALFVTANTAALRGNFGYGPGLGSGPGASLRRNYLLNDRTGSLFNPFPNYTEVRYEAVSYLADANRQLLRAATSDDPEDIRARYLELPSLDPRIPALAAQIAAAAGDRFDRAASIENYLRTHYTYTLALTASPGRDPLASFLFERRAGHCEYFASAMTIMLRSLGIPARYVNGFQTGEYNEVGGDFMVRASDAHSWVEAYFPGFGWIEFDPTPAAKPTPQRWFRAFAKYWDWFQLEWSDWVVNYDFLHQVTLAQGFERNSRGWASRLRVRLARVEQQMTAGLGRWQARAARSPGTAALAIAVVALAAALLWFVSRNERVARLVVWSRLHLRRGRDLHPRLASSKYAEMLGLLARRGWHKPPEATAMEFARSIEVPELNIPVTRLTEIYQAARFGHARLDVATSDWLLREISRSISRGARKPRCLQRAPG